MSVSMRVIGAVLLLGFLAACSDPCDLVIGCSDSRRVAVEGRVLAAIDGSPVPAATVRILAEYAGRVDSAESSSDSRGLFSLSLGAPGSDDPRISLRVIPPNRPGYVVALAECRPVVQWGDACVLIPVVSEPGFPIFRFRHQSDSSPVTQTQVTFKRTGGATLFTRSGEGAAVAVDSVTSVTDDAGVTNLFPLAVWAGSMDAVVGDLMVDFPPPVGRVVRRDYRITASPFYTTRVLTTELVGPGPP